MKSENSKIDSRILKNLDISPIIKKKTISDEMDSPSQLFLP